MKNRMWRDAEALDFLPGQQPVITPIVPGLLYVGNNAAGHDEDLLHYHGITEIVNCRLLGTTQLFDGITTHHFRMLDGFGNKPELFKEAMECVDGLMVGGKPTLVHCWMGQSRSVTVVTTAWSILSRPILGFGESLDAVKRLHPEANPKPFMRLLARDYLMSQQARG